jgi:futalosine hydrolase
MQLEKINRILIVTAVSAEREAVLRGIQASGSRCEVIAGGVGPISAAINTVKALHQNEYDLIISAGIGGGFKNKAEVGAVVISTEIISGDQGAETLEGFLSLEDLNFGMTRVKVNPILVDRLVEGCIQAGVKAVKGPIVTVSTATGTADTAKKLMGRYAKVKAEAMEGFGAAASAHDRGIPVIEIRAISNIVGPRDREAWRIKEALASLEAVSKVLSEVF